jgi:hypothetical protein
LGALNVTFYLSWYRWERRSRHLSFVTLWVTVTVAAVVAFAVIVAVCSGLDRAAMFIAVAAVLLGPGSSCAT